MTVFAFLLGHHVNATNSTSDLPGRQRLTIDPQQVRELLSIPSIGLLLGVFFRMNQHDLQAFPFSQLFNQPIIETAHLGDRRGVNPDVVPERL